MRAVSLNYRDLLMVKGCTRRSLSQPSITPFSDGCGMIEAVGPGVTRVKRGDRVATMFFQNWICGPPTTREAFLRRWGRRSRRGPANWRCSTRMACRSPEFLTDQQAATLPCAALTAWRALFEDARLQPGDTVVLQAPAASRSLACSSPTQPAIDPDHLLVRRRSSPAPRAWEPTIS